MRTINRTDMVVDHTREVVDHTREVVDHTLVVDRPYECGAPSQRRGRRPFRCGRTPHWRGRASQRRGPRPISMDVSDDLRLRKSVAVHEFVTNERVDDPLRPLTHAYQSHLAEAGGVEGGDVVVPCVTVDAELTGFGAPSCPRLVRIHATTSDTFEIGMSPTGGSAPFT